MGFKRPSSQSLLPEISEQRLRGNKDPTHQELEPEPPLPPASIPKHCPSTHTPSQKDNPRPLGLPPHVITQSPSLLSECEQPSPCSKARTKCPKPENQAAAGLQDNPGLLSHLSLPPRNVAAVEEESQGQRSLCQSPHHSRRTWPLTLTQDHPSGRTAGCGPALHPLRSWKLLLSHPGACPRESQTCLPLGAFGGESGVWTAGCTPMHTLVREPPGKWALRPHTPVTARPRVNASDPPGHCTSSRVSVS